jgi:hypothetical protein
MSTYAKRQGRAFKTPVTTYVHPETGRRVTVVSVMHIGLPSYYSRLREIVKEKEAAGSVVHCEGTGLEGLTPELIKQPLASTTLDAKVRELLARIPDLTEDEREVLLAMVDVALLMRRRVRELGWVEQMDKEGGLPTEPHWHNIDITVIDVIRRLGPDTLLYRMRQARKMLDWPAGNTAKPNAFRLKLAFLCRATASNKQRIQTKLRTGPYDGVLLERREKIALDGLHAATTDVVLLWGCMHLPAFEADLLSRGYLQESRTWHTACLMPSITAALLRMVVRWDPGRRTTANAPATQTTG